VDGVCAPESDAVAEDGIALAELTETAGSLVDRRGESGSVTSAVLCKDVLQSPLTDRPVPDAWFGSVSTA